MVRAKKTLDTPRVQQRETPSLEAGASYGEVGENRAAINAIPIDGKPPVGQVEAPAFKPAPQGNPLEAAAAYTPTVTPLAAPGAGGQVRPQRPMVAPDEETAQILTNWYEATGEQRFLDAAIQLSQ